MTRWRGRRIVQGYLVTKERKEKDQIKVKRYRRSNQEENKKTEVSDSIKRLKQTDKQGPQLGRKNVIRINLSGM